MTNNRGNYLRYNAGGSGRNSLRLSHSFRPYPSSLLLIPLIIKFPHYINNGPWEPHLIAAEARNLFAALGKTSIINSPDIALFTVGVPSSIRRGGQEKRLEPRENADSRRSTNYTVAWLLKQPRANRASWKCIISWLRNVLLRCTVRSTHSAIVPPTKVRTTYRENAHATIAIMGRPAITGLLLLMEWSGWNFYSQTLNHSDVFK